MIKKPSYILIKRYGIFTVLFWVLKSFYLRNKNKIICYFKKQEPLTPDYLILPKKQLDKIDRLYK